MFKNIFFCLIVAIGLWGVDGRIALANDWFEFDAPHERFCVIGDYATYEPVPSNAETLFDIGCVFDHKPQSPSARGVQDWNVVNVFNTQFRDVNTYENPPDNPTFEERVEFLEEQVSLIVSQYPSKTVYVVGNEMDRPHIEINGETEYLQDGELPEDYAVVYHELYTAIKMADSTAAVMPGGIVQPSQLRFEYLDIVLETYQATYGSPMPVDAWHIHNFVLNEGAYPGWGAGIPVGSDAESGLTIDMGQLDDLDIFVQNIIDFRQWMADNGYRDTPLVVGAVGILLPELFGYSPDRVTAFMEQTNTYLMTATDAEIGYPADSNRLVQQWAWLSLHTPAYNADSRDGFNGNLIDPATGELTDVGVGLKQFIRPDFVVTGAGTVDQNNDLLVTIEVVNTGIEPIREGSITITSLDVDGQSVETVVPVLDLLGGVENSQQLSVTIPNSMAEPHSITVEADAENRIEELSEVNNLSRFVVNASQSQPTPLAVGIDTAMLSQPITFVLPIVIALTLMTFPITRRN